MSSGTQINTKMLNTTIALILTSLLVYILIIGRAILIPFVVAIVVWYLIIGLTGLFSKIPFTQIRLPFFLALFLSLLVSGSILYSLINVITASISGIIAEAPKYQDKLQDVLNLINQRLNVELDIAKMFDPKFIPEFFSSIALTVTNIASNVGIIIIYVLFLILEYKTFDKKIRALSLSSSNYTQVNQSLSKISHDVNSYMRIKSLVSFLTGALSYTVLTFFGITNAEFWALLIFILNFIPTIGSIAALLITLLAVSIQFSTLASFLFLAALLIAIQIVLGNIIEPRLMGRNLNLSPLVILLALAFWGSVWGIIGMFLCVPATTIMVIVLSRFENTRRIAVMLSSDPDIVERQTHFM